MGPGSGSRRVGRKCVYRILTDQDFDEDIIRGLIRRRGAEIDWTRSDPSGTRRRKIRSSWTWPCERTASYSPTMPGRCNRWSTVCSPPNEGRQRSSSSLRLCRSKPRSRSCSSSSSPARTRTGKARSAFHSDAFNARIGTRKGRLRSGICGWGPEGRPPPHQPGSGRLRRGGGGTGVREWRAQGLPPGRRARRTARSPSLGRRSRG